LSHKTDFLFFYFVVSINLFLNDTSDPVVYPTGQTYWKKNGRSRLSKPCD